METLIPDMPQPPSPENNATSLRGQLLIAMPGLLDPNFVHSVVYICQHSEAGAMGITINRPLGLPLSQVVALLRSNKVLYYTLLQRSTGRQRLPLVMIFSSPLQETSLMTWPVTRALTRL